jgi:hypothetical protein
MYALMYTLISDLYCLVSANKTSILLHVYVRTTGTITPTATYSLHLPLPLNIRTCLHLSLHIPQRYAHKSRYIPVYSIHGTSHVPPKPISMPVLTPFYAHVKPTCERACVPYLTLLSTLLRTLLRTLSHLDVVEIPSVSAAIVELFFGRGSGKDLMTCTVD